MVKNKKIFIFYILISFLCKIFFGFFLYLYFKDSFFSIDSSAYLDSSKSLIQTGKFAINNVYEFSRTPGYPLLLTPIYYFNINSYLYLIVFNQLQIAIILYFTIQISYKYLNLPSNYIYLLSLLLLFDPLLTLYQFKFLSEISFSVFFLGSLYFFISWNIKKENYILIIAFIFLSISTYIRPGTIYLILILYVYLLLYIFKTYKDYKINSIIYLSTGLIFAVLIVCAWILRNYSLIGLSSFSTIQAINLYQVNTAGIISHANNIDYASLQKIMSERLNLIPINLRSHFANREFISAISLYPFSAIFVLLKGLVMVLIEPGVQEWLNFLHLRNGNSGILNSYYSMPILDFLIKTIPEDGLFIIISFIFSVISFLVLLISIFGLIKSIKENYFSFIFLIYITYLCVISSGPYSYSRFRVPIIPLLLIFFIYYFYARKKSNVENKELR